MARKTWRDALRWSEDMEISTADRRDRQAGRIVVYDDDRLLLDVLVTMLRREGHQVTATQSEQEAISLARAQHFELAVVDLGRQRSKGYDLVVTISATSPETPIVAMSAYPAQEVVRFAREHAQAFLEKPFSLAELVDVVRCILVQGQRARETVRADSSAGPRIRVAAVGSGAQAIIYGDRLPLQTIAPLPAAILPGSGQPSGHLHARESARRVWDHPSHRRKCRKGRCG